MGKVTILERNKTQKISSVITLAFSLTCLFNRKIESKQEVAVLLDYVEVSQFRTTLVLETKQPQRGGKFKKKSHQEAEKLSRDFSFCPVLGRDESLGPTKIEGPSQATQALYSNLKKKTPLHRLRSKLKQINPKTHQPSRLKVMPQYFSYQSKT